MKSSIGSTLKTAKKTQPAENTLFQKNFYSIKKSNNIVLPNENVSRSREKLKKIVNDKSPIKTRIQDQPQTLKINQTSVTNPSTVRDSEPVSTKSTMFKKTDKNGVKEILYPINVRDNRVNSRSKIESSPTKLKDIKEYLRVKSLESKKKIDNKFKPEVRKSIPKPEPYPAESTKKQYLRNSLDHSPLNTNRNSQQRNSRQNLVSTRSEVTPPKVKSIKEIKASLSKSRKVLGSRPKLENTDNSNVFNQDYKDIPDKPPTPSENRSRSSISRKSISPDRINKKVQERYHVAQNSFKLNLQDLLKTDELFTMILNSKPTQKNAFTFDVLRQYLIYNYCFLLKDLNVLFTNEAFKERMRRNYLKETNFVVILLLMLIEVQAERSASQQSLFQNNQLAYNLALAAEIYELIVQIVSQLHITYILRIEIFLDRAAIYYQTHGVYKQLKHLLSKRKSNYSITFNKQDENYEEHIFKIERYLDLTEQAMHELFRLNRNFIPLSSTLTDNIFLINQRKGDTTIKEINAYFQTLHISFDNKGLNNFDTNFLASLMRQTSKPQVIIEQNPDLPSPPFIKEPKNPSKNMTLVMDLDETLIHYPDDKLSSFEDSAHHHILVRPLTTQFLTEIAEYYEIIIFTAASQNYADRLIDIIDENRVIKHRLYRQHMTYHNGTLVKDISKIGRDLRKVIILDNTPENFVLQPDNGVYVRSWRGELNDRVFMLLAPVFKNLAIMNPYDVREVLIELRNMLVGGEPDK